jgi:putative Holliday junction resolvase
MRILALDIGEKRIGIAGADSRTKIAMPISTLPTADVLAAAHSFQRIIQDNEPELLLVGLPLSLDGQEHGQAERVREQAQRIADATGLPLCFFDERLTSAQAKRYLRENGFTERQMRGRIDMVAASLLLQAYIDAGGIE